MLRLAAGIVVALWFTAIAGATSMKATAPDQMMPQGGGEAMRECIGPSMQQQIKMQDRAHFVKECVAKKLKQSSVLRRND